MGATLAKLKNKHLLAVIAVLCAGNVLACLALVFGEKGNARRVEDLTGELTALRQQQTQDRDNANRKLDKLARRTEELHQQQAQALRSAQKEIQRGIDETKTKLQSAQEYLDKLQTRKWNKPEDAPWHADLRELQKRLAEAEKKLNQIVPKKDAK